MSTTVLKHEFSTGGTSRGAGNVSELSFDNLNVLVGLNKMFEIKANEVILGVEVVQRGNGSPSIRAHIERIS